MKKRIQENYLWGFYPFALAAFLVSLVGGITTALSPAFIKEQNLPYNNTTWQALAMAISSAALAPVLGNYVDVLGKKKGLLLGVGIFALGNGVTALASNLPIMLVARFVTGIGTAAITPVVLTYILTEFPQDKISKGFSLYMLVSSSAVILGPPLGGLLVEKQGWRFMMWLCTGISVFVFLVCLFTKVPTKKIAKNEKQTDFFGAGMILVFFGLFLCVPAFGQNFGWTSPGFLWVLGLGVISLLLLIFVEKKAKNPILQGEVLGRKAFILTVLALFLTQGLLQANMTGIILFVQGTQPQNTMISGYSISVMYLGLALGAVVLGPLADKKEPKQVLTASLVCTLIGCGLMWFFTADAPAVLLFSALGILGFGLGANATIFMKVALSGIPDSLAGTGTGTYGLFRDLSAPFGVAVLLPLFTNRMEKGVGLGLSSAHAAVEAIRLLAVVEAACVILGIIVVQFLPRVRKEKRNEA